jgi:cyclopropane fatty-acyl-phospholipid synthase-like methyltransferase
MIKTWIKLYYQLPCRFRWELVWARKGHRPFWMLDGARPTVIESVKDGWLTPGMTVLEIGCGIGQEAVWLADAGFKVLGVDFSRAAIRRARKNAGDKADLSFAVMDVTRPMPLDRKFDALIDSGCLHSIKRHLWPKYLINLLKWSRPGTRFLLHMHTLDVKPDARSAEVKALFAPDFEIVRLDCVPSKNVRARNGFGLDIRLVRRTSAPAGCE